MTETKGPRIAPLPPDQWSDEVMQAIALLRPPDAKHQLPRRQGGPKGLNVLGTLANHPALMHAYHAFNGHILSSSTLTPRDREALILRVAALRDAAYEWEQHVVIASGADIADEEIERVRTGAGAPEWSERDAAMLLAVDELVADAMISDVTWGKLAATFDTQQLMDLIFTVGAYDLLAMAFRSFGIELDADLRASRVMSTNEAPADPPAATVTRRELAVARALDQARSRAENRVELFLDAARELMGTNSGEFTVQEVVDRSGQSLRTFYQYFAGKHELLLALFEESIRAAAAHLAEVVDRTEGPLERLHDFTHEYFRMCRLTPKGELGSGLPPPIVEFAQRLLVSRPEEAAQAFAPLVVQLEELLTDAATAGALRPGLDLRRITGVVLQATMFNSFAAAISGSSLRPDGEVESDALWDLLLGGIGADD